MIVLGASALVDVVLDQEASSWVLDQLEGEEVCAPAHQPAEVLSALARLVRAGELESGAAEAAIDEVAALAQELVVPSREHLHAALWAQDGIRVLDGLYVSLAQDRRCPVVTTDRRLARSSSGADVRVPPQRP